MISPTHIPAASYFSAASPTTSPCRGGYTLQFGDYCYAYAHESKTWTDAETVCRALGGFLPEVFSREQNEFLRGIAAQHGGLSIWIGGNDIFVEGQWFWSTSGNPIRNFTDWYPTQPDNYSPDGYATENCLEINGNQFHWNDALCDARQPFICQIHHSLATSSFVLG